MFKAIRIHLFFSVLVFASPLAVEASTLYRCIDELGHATYTNYNPGNRKCSVLSRETKSRAASAGSTGSASSAVRNPSPADFPKVASETQKNRDGDRHYILEQEMAVERKNLEEARKALAAQVNAQSTIPAAERVQPIRDRIALHERNLNALQREISNLK